MKRRAGPRSKMEKETPELPSDIQELQVVAEEEPSKLKNFFDVPSQQSDPDWIQLSAADMSKGGLIDGTIAEPANCGQAATLENVETEPTRSEEKTAVPMAACVEPTGYEELPDVPLAACFEPTGYEELPDVPWAACIEIESHLISRELPVSPRVDGVGSVQAIVTMQGDDV